MNGILGNVWNNVLKPEMKGVLDMVSTTKEVELGEDFDVPKALFNSMPDVIEEASTIKQIAEDPITYGKAMIDLEAGILGHLAPNATAKLDSLFGYEGRADAMKLASETKADMIDQFGSYDAFKKTINEKPVSTALMVLGVGAGLKAATKLAAPSTRKAYNEMELAVSKGMDNITDFGQSVDELYSQNMGMTRLIGHQGNSTGAIFRELDMNKIGTNTGNSVQGYGIYISGQERTAKQYAGRDDDMLEDFNAMMLDEKNPIAKEVYDRAASGYYPATIRTDMVSNIDPKDMEVFEKAMEDVVFEYDSAKSQIYEIELDDDVVATFINREATKRNQTPAVQAEMNRLGLPDEADGGMLYSALRNEALKILKDQPSISVLGMTRKSEQMASEYLNSIGIKGMTFQDQFGIANNLDKGLEVGDPRNYVIYDTDFARVKKRQNIDIDENTPKQQGLLEPILTKTTLKELAEQNPSTTPKVPVNNVFLNDRGAIPKDKKVFDIKDSEILKLPLLDIDVTKIIPTQKTISINNLKDVSKAKDIPSIDEVLLVEDNGMFYVMDGHHRIANKILNADKFVSARVVNKQKQGLLQ